MLKIFRPFIYAAVCSVLMVLSCFCSETTSTPVLHPVPLAANADTKTCMECHSSLKEEKYVHSALEMGCTACHEVKNVKGGTEVNLLQPKDVLCFMCHTKSSDPVQHQPYAEGACVVCHSPHSSNFPAHTWAAHQDICMGCHVMGMPKVDRANKTVTVPWGQSLTFKQMGSWYYLGLDSTHTKNHPVKGHPVSGPNPLVPGAPAMTCLSCHRAHTSTVANLIPPKYPQQTQLCVSCHTDM